MLRAGQDVRAECILLWTISCQCKFIIYICHRSRNSFDGFQVPVVAENTANATCSNHNWILDMLPSDNHFAFEGQSWSFPYCWPWFRDGAGCEERATCAV